MEEPMERRQITFVSIAAAALMVAGGAAVAQEHHKVVPVEKIQWQPAPPVLPPGAEISVLEGNPGESGPVTMRLRLPADYRIPAHWHGMTESVTVISGTFYIGAGDRLDVAASQALRPGGFVLLPARMRHFAWVKAETVVQITLMGPFDIFYVDPATDPRRTSTN
jgi:hypothetical protein